MKKYKVFLEIGDISVKCPYCKCLIVDEDETYYKRMNKNKSGITRVMCFDCGYLFKITTDMKGDYVVV